MATGLEHKSIRLVKIFNHARKLGGLIPLFDGLLYDSARTKEQESSNWRHSGTISDPARSPSFAPVVCLLS